MMMIGMGSSLCYEVRINNISMVCSSCLGETTTTILYCSS
jgi:uncharacterized membrane protein